jgi:serine/threonine protein phosphatase PrpC
MARDLTVSIGQCSAAGRKQINQDFHGAIMPTPPLLGTKGIALVLTDGISSSAVSRVASETAVKSFLTDYYCTPDAWSVKQSGARVIAAVNSWLHGETRRSAFAYERDKGYVCTFSALVLRAATAHIFHAGDSRIYRFAGERFEQLTQDHRVIVSSQESYLGRALGINPHVEIDYVSVRAEPGDVFVLATDGVCAHVEPRDMQATIAVHYGDLDAAAQAIVRNALDRGSPDNLTIQIARIETVGEADVPEAPGADLPPAPLLEQGAILDGFRILRELHASHRSHVYLAESPTGQLAALKVPSIEMRDDPAYLRRLMMEEWVARRVRSPHVVRAAEPPARRTALYVALDYVEGQSLAQWMIDHPQPALEAVRDIVEQIAKGLQALHRMEMLHQDLRPQNILIDEAGTVRIVDLGSVRIGGLDEPDQTILGTVQYTAPEYFVGDSTDARADLFSLGVIAYQMLTGRLPYGVEAAKVRTRAHQRRLKYRSAIRADRPIPIWVDGALRCAVHPDPAKRYQALSEFIYDMRHPNPVYSGARRPSLLERNPLLFWKSACALLVLALVIMSWMLVRR